MGNKRNHFEYIFWCGKNQKEKFYIRDSGHKSGCGRYTVLNNPVLQGGGVSEDKISRALAHNLEVGYPGGRTRDLCMAESGRGLKSLMYFDGLPEPPA